MSTEQLIDQLREMHESHDRFLRWFGASGSPDLDARLAPAAAGRFASSNPAGAD